MTTPLGERSLGELVATLTRDLALLLHQEIELVKADLGWSFLIVGGGYLVLGGIAALVGIKMLTKAKPSSRTAESVKADIHAIVRKPAATRDQ